MTRAGRGREALIRTAVLAAVAGFLVLALAQFPGTVRWERAWAWRALFLEGLVLTAAISAGALVLGLLLGGLAGLARVSGSAALDQAAFTYVEVVRGTPWLVQIYIWYFGIAQLLHVHEIAGMQTALVVGIVGLGVFSGAYVAEIVRAAVESVERGQWEAGRSLGLSHRTTLVRVILPQATRRMIPPLTGEAVSLIKESSLLSIIGVTELTYYAASMRAREYATLEALLPLAALYLSLTIPLSWLTRRLERRLGPPGPLPVARL